MTDAWVMTPEQIAPHQVKVRSVTFVKQWQAITGDLVRAYRAPDGEVYEVAVRLGAYARDPAEMTDAQAQQDAIASLNAMRQGRAGRIARGEPVTCQLRATGE
jgi:hypothetical protein